MENDPQITSASQGAVESVEKLFSDVEEAFPDAVTQFESRWTACQVKCQLQTTSTRIDSCVQTDEFEALKRLGPKIIPFVVFKLAKGAEQDSWGVFLYNALENDPQYRVILEDDPISKESLRRYGSKIVDLNNQRNKTVDERIVAWKYHCDHETRSSNSADYTDCDEYWDLMGMGTSIIPQLMLAYFHQGWGFWFQLLHEIIHGRKMGAYMFQMGVEYDQWCYFFNDGEHEQAPKYIPTNLDRRLHHDCVSGYDPRK